MTSRQQQWLILSGVIMIVILVALLLLANALITSSRSTGKALYSGLTRRVTSDGAPVLGSVTAPITVVEFIDFSCPHCADYRQTVHAIIERYVSAGQARLEMRILAGLDPVGSPVAARAALCASEQEAFWEMQDELLRLQEVHGRSAFSTNRIRQAADALQLDSAGLLECVNNTGRYQEALQSNVDLAVSLGVEVTPSILIRQGSGRPAWIEQNGQRLTGSVPLDVLSGAIDTMIAESP